MKKGFSLGEMVVTVGIVGFLAVVLIPVLKSAMPNQEMLMFKKAYYIIERSVAELVNDEDLYPEDNAPNAKQYFGNVSEQKYKGKTYSGSTKFCELLATKLNRSSSISCSSKVKWTDSSESSLATSTFATSDGMFWQIPISSFASETAAEKIYIDVNGKKGPNCFYSVLHSNTCSKPDRFTVLVYQDGRVEAGGVMEREYLNRVSVAKDAKNETDEAKLYENSEQRETGFREYE